MLSLDEIIGDCSDSGFSPLVDLRLVTHDGFTAEMASRPKTLAKDEIHVWPTDVSRLRLNRGDLDNLLSADELERMNRFRFEADRNNFLFCRTVLRILLASYLGASPAELRFAYSSHGKPSLAGSADTIEFNLSHSENQLLIAVVRGRKVGVDIEKADPDLKLMEVAQRFFSPAELRKLAAQPVQARPRLFYSYWTLKEAWLKARGDGLSFPLSGFDVCDRTESGEVKLVTRPDSREASKWSIVPIAAAEGFSAAVAVERQSCLSNIRSQQG
jgi:4'-phosphopantetheinyl transferase